MYFPNAASGNEWNRMATLSIRFYSLHPWVHCVLYKFIVFEIFVVEKSIRNVNVVTYQLFVWCRVGDACSEEGFFALDAGGAASAVGDASFVARPCLAIVDAECLAVAGYLTLRDAGVGGEDLHVGVCALGHGFAHGADELRAAVGIDGVVAAVVGYHHFFQSSALGHAAGDGEHDAVAEGHHGRGHVLSRVVSLRDGLSPLQQRRLEVLVHEVEGDGDVGNAQSLAVHLRQRNLPCVVVAAIVEGDAEGDVFLIFVEHGDGVHASRDDDD